MPASPFLLDRGHLYKYNIATVKTRMIWGGGVNPKHTIPEGREEQGREIIKETLEKIRQSENRHATGSQQSTVSCSRSYWSAVARLNSIHRRGLSAISITGCPQITSTQSLEIPCHIAISALWWEIPAFLSTILDFNSNILPNRETKSSQVRKPGFFPVPPITYLWTVGISSPLPQFLTLTGPKVTDNQPQNTLKLNICVTKSI